VSEAEDIFQEAFIKIFKNIHTLENIDSINSWVKSTVIRTAIDHYRHAVHERSLVGYELIAEVTENEEDLFSNLARDQILQIINALPDGYRLVVNLYLIDGYNHLEIAEMLNITEGTSKSQLSRARNLLKENY
jgi:RNA polymerase sigma-70 factor (ECF subfamily)